VRTSAHSRMRCEYECARDFGMRPRRRTRIDGKPYNTRPDGQTDVWLQSSAAALRPADTVPRYFGPRSCGDPFPCLRAPPYHRAWHATVYHETEHDATSLWNLMTTSSSERCRRCRRRIRPRRAAILSVACEFGGSQRRVESPVQAVGNCLSFVHYSRRSQWCQI
jgi:hypothetical protein